MISLNDSLLYGRGGELVAIGAGSAGKNILKHSQSSLSSWRLIYMDNEPSEDLSRGVQVWDRSGLCGKELLPAMEPYLRDCALVVNVSALGGDTGYRLSKEMGRHCKYMDIPVVGIFILPFTEEVTRFRRANAQLSRLAQLYPQRVAVPNSFLKRRCASRPFNDCMDIVNVSVARVLLSILAWFEHGNDGGAIIPGEPGGGPKNRAEDPFTWGH